MSKRKTEAEKSSTSSKKTKMSGDTSTCNLDAIPSDTLKKVSKCLECFCVSKEKLCEVSALLKNDFIQGLEKNTHDKMLATFIRTTPDGTEKGDFLTLDLGGTNFRVQLIHLNLEQTELKLISKEKWSIREEIMQGPGEKLFDYIADHLGDFLDSQNLKKQILPLGFTFSFPCRQDEIDKARFQLFGGPIEDHFGAPVLNRYTEFKPFDDLWQCITCVLIRWTKGFSCSGVEGKDVVQLLKDAIHRRGDYNIGPVAVVNDTVSTMLSCSYKDPNCKIGLIIGTGTNACYMEEMKNVKYLEGEDGQMCINTEWGGFGDDGSLKDIQTEFDKAVDKDSINPGVHIFEKMISGMYLGEIVRLLVIKLTEDKLLFKGKMSNMLEKQGSFDTKFISEIEKDNEGLENAKIILTDLGLEYETVDLHVVRLVCETVSTRAADLCAAAIATVVKRIHENRGQSDLETTVGVDGSVYKEHPNFRKRLQEMVRCLSSGCAKCDITFLDSDGGSGKGAAMAAAVAQRLRSGC